MKLLIVDDSAFMRTALAAMFRGLPGWEVHLAKDGADGLARCAALRPDVVTLDINMPVMDGLTCLARIMSECPTRVVMVSSLTQEGAMATLEALYMGAVDCIPKPGGTVSIHIDRMTREIVERVVAAAQATPRPGPVGARRAPVAKRRVVAASEGPRGEAAVPGLVLVGTSTGGPRALEELLGGISAGFPWPVVIAQHIPANFTASLAQRLDRLSALRVSEVRGLCRVEAGCAYLARGEADLLISRRGADYYLMPAPCDARYSWHPSVERMVRSALTCVAPRQLMGVQLTGMGDDGAQAFLELRRLGGHTVAESPETTVMDGMPGALVALGGAEQVLPLPRIAAQLERWL